MNTLRITIKRFVAAAVGFTSHDGTLMAAAIAYYLAVSFFPLLLVLVAVLGYVLTWTTAGQSAQEQILATLAEQASPQLSEQVGKSLAVVRDQAPTGGAAGFALLVFAAVALFSQFDYAIDRIWTTSAQRPSSWRARIARILLTRLKALAMLLGVGAFVIAVTIASVVWEGAQSAVAEQFAIGPLAQSGARIAINVSLNLLAFAVMYRFLPHVPVRWLHALGGGLVAALLWEVGRQVLAVYLFRQDFPTAYGVIGSFLAIMLWAYYAAMVVLYGAEFTRVLFDEKAAEQAPPLGSMP